MREDAGEEAPSLEIEPASMKSSGRCACCGRSRSTAWGFVYRDGGPRACYFVEWTLGEPACSARFDVVVGDWFDGTTEADRQVVSLAYRLLDGGPSFSLVDADGRPAAEVGQPTKGSAVASTPLADEVMTIASAVLEADGRIRELTARPAALSET